MTHPGYPLCRAFCVLGLLAIAGLNSLEARIGDSVDQMNGRMLQPDLGKYFSWPKDMDERARERAIKENPIYAFASFLPTAAEDWREQIYWKSAMKRQLSNEDGWRIHVYFLRGSSVLECYRRVGNPLNEFEINAILTRFRSNQAWRKVARKDGGDTVLGFEYELGDNGQESLRARRQGDWLIIYHKRLDDLLLARKAKWDAEEEKRKALERAEQERTAPVSVEGF
ncbi:MAG: hypothetical protein NTU80_13630 [Verrucomicrobia bacterium]|nr:hypothetical protein [Verrucomicrobiota bacterium]